MFNEMAMFEAFVNRDDISIISVDLKVVEQSFFFQENFAAIVFYEQLNPSPTAETP